MLHLTQDWKRIIKRAWSVRLMVLAAILSGAEVVFGFVDASVLGMPRGVFAALAGVVSLAAFPARILAQRSMTDDDAQA